MNADSNPYAPPGVAEPEAPSTRYWYVDGIDLLAKNGATLPKVDLDTGSTGGEMKSMPRVLQTTSAGGLAGALILMVCIFQLQSRLALDPAVFIICIVLGSLVFSRLQALRGSTTRRVTVWTFVEAPRARRATLRRRLRIAAMILSGSSMMLVPMLLSAHITDYVSWMLRLFIGGIVLILALAIWAVFDRPKSRTRTASPGWLRISPVHPEALAALRRCEEEEIQQQSTRPPGRKRLVRTVYYHRFPLRLLIGHNLNNPLVVFRVLLMKILRSRLLVRDSYHFSEATEVPLQDLCGPLREAAASWLAAHPGWAFVTADHLPSPAGDLMIENAVLASPGLEHCARINRAWMEQKPEKGVTHFTFITWLADGTHASTCDQPFLVLRNPHLHHRASGPPEDVYQAHLRNIATLAISPAKDISEVLARVLHEKEETDRLLTEKGLQSGVASFESP